MLSEFCVRRPVSATMLVMSLVVLGTFSFRGLGVDLFPRADPATVSVALSLPGASPDEMSTSVVEPMEQAISGVSGIDEIQARISEGQARMTVRFVLERDLNDAVNDVREKVAGAIRTAPPNLLPPVITKIDPDADPVMSLIVSSKSMSLRTLTELADKQIVRGIQTVNGVGEVSLTGGRAREIHVVVDIEKLNSYGLSMTQVREALVAENVEIPGGTIEQGKGQLLLRTLGRMDASDDFNNIVIATKDGTPIRVADIGRAEDTSERPTSAVWLGDAPAVMIDIRRAMGENTVAVVEGVRTALERVERTLPPGVDVTITRDDSRFIYASVASLEEHLIFGALFAAIVVMFFIRNIRAVIISALAIPASIIATFTLMRIMGFTLNNMTLLAITLAVGIVIDDAIVVLENIFRYIEEKKMSPFDAAIQGTRRSGAAGHGDDALARGHLPADRIHGRLRQAVHLPVRLDDGVRDYGVDARQLHDDADAQLALSQGVGRRGRSQVEGIGLLPLARPALHGHAELGARSSGHDLRHLGRHRAHGHPAELDGGP